MDTSYLHPPDSTSNVQEHLQFDNRSLRISPTDIGSMVKQGQCPRFMKLQGDSNSRETIFSSNDWVEKSSLALLSTEGNEFEETIYKYLDELEDYDECVTHDLSEEENLSPDGAVDRLRTAIQEARDSDPLYGKVHIFKQFPIQGIVGPFSVAGKSDMVCVFPTKDGVEVRVFDIKASWNEKTSQQIQTSVYTLLINREYPYLESNNVTISAGIIHKDNFEIFEESLETLEFPDIEDLPYFNVEPREDDARRLLSPDSEMYNYITKVPRKDNGEIIPEPSVDELISVIDEIPFQIDSNCENCKYRDICFTRAIETLDVAILGVSQGTRHAMHTQGIESLRDLANITTHLADSNEYMDVEINEEYEDIVLELQREHGVQNITDLSLQAKLFIGQLNPDDPDADGMSQILPPKGDTYPRTLPDFHGDNSIVESQGVKVFINPQYDYISDSIIQFNAKIKLADENIAGGLTKHITKTIDNIPLKDPVQEDSETGRVDIEGVRENERNLAEEFTEELLHEIEAITNTLGFAENTFLHFYLYNRQEENWLVECMERHSDIGTVNAFRNILGVRDMGEHEQQLWGYIEEEIERCYLVNRLPTFLPAMHNSFLMKNDDRQTTNSWSYEHNGMEYQLQRIFGEQFFDYKREYVYENQDISLTKPTEFTPERSYSNDGTPIEAYTGAQLPLEYFWGCEEFNLLDENLFQEDEDQVNRYIQKFLYTSGSTDRITKSELEAFGAWAVDALDVIESNMRTSFKVNKKSLDVTNFDSFSLDSRTFSDAVQDYVEMEHESTKEDLLSEFEKPVSSRVKSGKAIPLEVTNIETSGDNGFVTAIEGELIYDEFGFEDIGFIQASSKMDTGDYAVLSPFEKTTDGGYVTMDDNGSPLNPEDILKSPSGIIQNLNSNRIKISLRNYDKQRRNLVAHQESTPYPYQQGVYHGQQLVLDAQLSTYSKKHHLETLDQSSRNNLYTMLEDILETGSIVSQTSKFDSTKIKSYIQALEETDDDKLLTPNEKQQDFIKELSNITILQGPPGTGKTSGALTNTILSRVYANSSWSMTGAITGPSNTSVDELLDDVADALDLISYHTDLDLNVSLHRVMSSSHSIDPEDRHDQVEYISDISQATDLIDRLENQQLGGQNTLIFGTPSMIKRLLEKHGHDYNSTSQWFDLLVADEASMLTLPDLFMAGAYMDPEGQLLISGDHRQMSPVQTHEWEDETRPSIQKYVPYLSTLDYMRFLRGDTLDRIGFPDTHIDSPNAAIPLKQLEQTYRCHTTIADFLQEWVYSKDNIDYTSDETNSLSVNKTFKTKGIESVLGDEPMVVITHSDKQSQESNIVESHIAESIMNELNEWNGDSGVVTPHSSQKGLLKDRGVSDEADTVERFQGGEKDLIMVSATVSDPSFIRKEDEFLLNPNRVNVAISRMKNKLIVIVPDSVFEHIPSDVDVYDESVIWNGLYNAVVDETNSEKWSGSLNEFVGESVSRGDVDVNVYSK